MPGRQTANGTEIDVARHELVANRSRNIIGGATRATNTDSDDWMTYCPRRLFRGHVCHLKGLDKHYRDHFCDFVELATRTSHSGSERQRNRIILIKNIGVVGLC